MTFQECLDNDVCFLCGQQVCIRNGQEHTGYCDPCAQSRIEDAQAALVERIAVWVAKYDCKLPGLVLMIAAELEQEFGR